MALPLLNYFQDGEWVDPPGNEDTLEVLAADSFLVHDGEVVELARHEGRFREAVLEVAEYSYGWCDEFISRSSLWYPREGRWFPRLDLVTDGESHWFRYHHRLAPPASTTAMLGIAPTDTRQVPWRKGPDLERMAELRAAMSDVADEALIVSDGIIIEGAYSAIMVIEPDTDIFSVTPARFQRIGSVTEDLIIECIHRRGDLILETAHRLEDLEDKEVWVLSALHGIRVATGIVGGPPLRVNHQRRDEFQQLWKGFSHPIDAVF